MGEKIVIYSGNDPAGKTIAKELRKLGVKPRMIPESTLYLQKTDFKAELIVVASKHRSETGKPVLTTHSPGNYGVAEYGGRERELGIAPAEYLRACLTALEEENTDPKYEVCFEATHHGPTSLKVPVMYAEVGSGPSEWQEQESCRVVAESIKKIIESGPEEKTCAIGLGGGHYCRKFSKIKDYAIGHICPKYNLSNLDSEMLSEMIEKTMPGPEVALVEKKGLGREKERINSLLEKTGLEIKKI